MQFLTTTSEGYISLFFTLALMDLYWLKRCRQRS